MINFGVFHFLPKKNIKDCPLCQSELLRLGHGTERIEEVLLEKFPTAKIARIDRDTTQKKDSMNNFINRMHSGDIDILVGTQMIAKGHHFPNITLAAIVDADLFIIDDGAGGTNRKTAASRLKTYIGAADFGDVDENIIPDGDATRNIGSAAAEFNQVFMRYPTLWERRLNIVMLGVLNSGGTMKMFVSGHCWDPGAANTTLNPDVNDGVTGDFVPSALDASTGFNSKFLFIITQLSLILVKLNIYTLIN